MISVNAIAMKALSLKDDGMSQEEAVRTVLERDGHNVEEMPANFLERIYFEMSRDFDAERKQAENELQQQRTEADKLAFTAVESEAEQVEAENTGDATNEQEGQQL